ncbi:DsbA family oxidoreductase [Salinicoccus carnicancri]|uniref:DsbA family oxidoreductase n=1 Tax=Salinicoccus carnicancri TaxID=558170 RepID=UPI0002DFF5A1|nr:DsbA family oxidoreductase [Salinicoccus carnicancri]
MKVEIWSDIGCPFCYIGKRNFEAGVEEFAGKDDLEVVYRSFQLDPTAEKEPDETMAELLAKKYNKSVKEAEIMNSQVADTAKAAGLEFNMEKVVPSNSRDAHRLVKFAREEGLDAEAMDRLYKAYFTDGVNVADTEELVEIGTGLGLEEEKIREMLDSDLYKEQVIEDQNVANKLGAQGVPLFVINRKYGISGAQPPQAFKEALTKAYEE